MDKSYLRAAFEWSARFGLLSVIESLRNDSRPAVGYAVPFGVAEAQSVQQSTARGKEPDDVKRFAARSEQIDLTIDEWATVSVVLGRGQLKQHDEGCIRFLE